MVSNLKVFFDINVNKSDFGRIEIELCKDIVFKIVGM